MSSFCLFVFISKFLQVLTHLKLCTFLNWFDYLIFIFKWPLYNYVAWFNFVFILRLAAFAYFMRICMLFLASLFRPRRFICQIRSFIWFMKGPPNLQPPGSRVADKLEVWGLPRRIVSNLWASDSPLSPVMTAVRCRPW